MRFCAPCNWAGTSTTRPAASIGPAEGNGSIREPRATMTATPADASPARLRWPWALLVLALAWVALARVPLVLNAEIYPGTPYMGIGPVFLSLPQALIWGANPSTLVSGGV